MLLPVISIILAKQISLEYSQNYARILGKGLKCSYVHVLLSTKSILCMLRTLLT